MFFHKKTNINTLFLKTRFLLFMFPSLTNNCLILVQELRKHFVFKIVPMINPDGVIVGNYRCSLSGHDLNRNYRKPNKETFPTVWHIKEMIRNLSSTNQVCSTH